MGQGAVGPAGTLSLAGVLSLAGTLVGDSGVQPAGTPLPLDLGHTAPPGGDALSHGRGLDVSVGAVVGLGGWWEGCGCWWGGGVPSCLCFHVSLLLQRGISPGFPLLMFFSFKNLAACQAGTFPWLGLGGGRHRVLCCWGWGQQWGQWLALPLAMTQPLTRARVAQMGKLRQG